MVDSLQLDDGSIIVSEHPRKLIWSYVLDFSRRTGAALLPLRVQLLPFSLRLCHHESVTGTPPVGLMSAGSAVQHLMDMRTFSLIKRKSKDLSVRIFQELVELVTMIEATAHRLPFPRSWVLGPLGPLLTYR